MKGDKYKQHLLDVIDDTQLVIQNKDLPRARAKLDDLAREFSSMPHEAFSDGRSIFAIAYTTYLALEGAYRRKQITNEQ